MLFVNIKYNNHLQNKHLTSTFLRSNHTKSTEHVLLAGQTPEKVQITHSPLMDVLHAGQTSKMTNPTLYNSRMSCALGRHHIKIHTFTDI